MKIWEKKSFFFQTEVNFNENLRKKSKKNIIQILWQ